jgi:hypothetical protein
VSDLWRRRAGRPQGDHAPVGGERSVVLPLPEVHRAGWAGAGSALRRDSRGGNGRAVLRASHGAQRAARVAAMICPLGRDAAKPCPRKPCESCCDAHGSRLHPERLARGDMNGSRLHPECLARGEAHGNSKLNEDKISSIFQLRSRGWAQTKIAKEFGVSQTQIGRILARKRWAHVAVDQAASALPGAQGVLG